MGSTDQSFWLLVGVQATFQAAFQAAYAKSASACASRDESGSVGIILARDDREAAGVLRQHARDLQRDPRRQQQLRLALDLW